MNLPRTGMPQEAVSTLELSNPTVRRSTRRRRGVPLGAFVDSRDIQFGPGDSFSCGHSDAGGTYIDNGEVGNDSSDISVESEEDLYEDDEGEVDLSRADTRDHPDSADSVPAEGDQSGVENAGDVLKRNRSKSLSPTRTSRPRKQCRTCAAPIKDEHDQNAEHLPAEVHNPPQIPLMMSRPGSLHDDASSGARSFMVKVILNTLAEERIIVVVNRDSLLRSTLYSKLLSDVKFGGYQMPCIQDANQYSEAAILQAVEFFTQNTSPSLSLREGSPPLLQQLQDKIDLYHFSIVAGLPELEESIVQQVTCCPDLGVGFFLTFTRLCYDRDSGHKVARKSSMGRALKHWLRYFLPDIMASNEISDGIQQSGGDLAAELEDVLQEHWAHMKEQRSAGTQ